MADEQQAEAAEKHQAEPAKTPGEPVIAMLLGHQAAVDRVHRHPVEEGEPLEMGGSLIHGPGQGCLRRVVQYLLEQLRKPGLCHIHLYGLSTGDAP